MKLRFYFFIGILLVSATAASAEIVDSKNEKNLALQPLTLSAKQVAKLHQLFPNQATDSDGDNVVNTNEKTSPAHLVWNKTPLNIILPVGKERLISFPGAVQFGYDNVVLTSEMLTIQNVNNTIYLQAKKSFEAQRVFVQLKSSGELILLNISAKAQADNSPLSIVLPQTQVISTTSAAASLSEEQVKETTLSYTALTRFAIQQLYAPKRLLKQPPEVYRVPMHTARTVSLMRGDKVIAMPLISWRSGDSFITAVLLRNRLPHSVSLDLRRLRGHWKTAALFPQGKLQPAGDRADSTTAFLISDQPFIEALGV